MNLKKHVLGILLAIAVPICATAQNVTVKGQVKDDAGEPVILVNVIQLGTTNGTVTDIDGNYTISVPSNSTLQFSFMGYETQDVAVSGRTTINVTLSEDAELLDEVVVIGYGVQKKSDLTGAVASVRADDLKNLSTTDAAAALQGKVSGIQVLSNSSPGSAAEIRVRGYSSNSSKIGPLYIVDGLQVESIQYLDPSMIESMEILKDAASAAIYGAEAGNGVVLITTKSGETGKSVVTYSAKFTQQDFKKRPLMNRSELIQYLGYEYGTAWVDNKLRDYDPGYKEWADKQAAGYNPVDFNGTIDTDWIGAYTEPSWSQQHSLTVSGGNQQGHYFTSLNYVNNDGIVKGDKDVYKRLTAQINADYQLFKWLQVGINNSVEKWSTKSVSQRGYGSSFESMLVLDPLTPVYWKSVKEMDDETKQIYDRVQAGDPDTPKYRFLGDENGFYANTQYSDVEGSPLAKRDAQDATSGGFNINGTLFANIMPIQGLTITSRLGYRINQGTSHNYTAPYYIGRGSVDNFTISANANTGWYYQWENFANYILNIGKNSITAMAGMSYRENNSDNVSASSTGADILSAYDPQFQYLNYVKGDATKSIGNLPSKSASLAYFGRLIYSYDNRYSLQANFRADAFDSSKLPADSRWGYFPSFSAGWTISNESFFKDNLDTDIFNFLKLRASWGRNGNIRVLDGYRYATGISVGNNWYQYSVDTPGSTFSSAPNLSNGLPNPNLTWETSEQLDLGLDARFLSNRLTLGVEYFNKQTKDLLFDISVPVELGASRSTVNGGKVLNTGWEFELGWRDRINAFNYSVGVNFSTLHNEVLELADRAARETRSDASSTNYQIQTAFEPGYSIWYLLGYKYEGIAEEDIYFTDANGNKKLMFAKNDPIFQDTNGDGNIAADDMVFIGNTKPTYTYGININLSWKGFDFALQGYGQGGNSILPVLHRTGFENGLKYYLENARTDENPGGSIPHPEKILSFNNPFWSSTGNTFKGDYFRFKQIQLGYTLPAKLTKRAAISNLRVYASLDDFFTISSYPGLDPETASTNSTTGGGLDWGSYPTMQKLIFGVNLTF